VKYGFLKILFILSGALLFISASAVQEPSRRFSGESAFTYIQKQCAFGPRNPGSAGHTACLTFLVEELKRFTPHVTRQPFQHHDADLSRTIPMNNIIARFPGLNPRAQRILLAAHWDTRPRADMEKEPERRKMPIPGANDGASGVAALLETARIMAEFPPPVPVDVVFFDGEDYGKEGEIQNYFLGARHFAKRLRTIYTFGILLDMIGDRDLRIPKEAYSVQMLPELVDGVWKRANRLRLPAFVNRQGEMVRDDHEPLIKAGVPIIDIIDFDYPFWHTLDDTPDKCSPESLEQVGSLLLSLIYEGL